MAKSHCLFSLVWLVASIGGQAYGGEPIRVMSFNIRFGTAPDGDNAWPNRRELLTKVIRDASPDVLGVQEALRTQLDELRKSLPDYALVGIGREPDGGGEYSAIMYRQDRFDLAAADTFWLSATPETPGSTTWGNTLPRVCTWARLLDRTSGRRLWAFNTHWDHQSQPARLESGRLIAQKVKDLVGDEPVLVMGDFNAGEQNPAIAALTEQGRFLEDTYRKLHPDQQPAGTFHGFGGTPGVEKIDAIFVRGPWRTAKAEIVHAHDGERYPSDHFPVTATVSLD